MQSGSEEEHKSPAPKLTRKGTPPHFGESTHIGMTVALLEGVDGSNASSTITESLMDILLEGVGGVGGRAIKGKTPRIDIRLSLNGGSVEAVAPSTQTHITVIDGMLPTSCLPRFHRLVKLYIFGFDRRTRTQEDMSSCFGKVSSTVKLGCSCRKGDDR